MTTLKWREKLSTTRNELDAKNEIITRLHKHLIAYNRFPHEGQSKVIKAFFKDKKKIIMGQCGRSFGKTEEILYMAWRFALTNPGTETYIVCPEISQARRIYWIPRRLQNYGPQEFVYEHRDSELRVVFKNGSHIMLAGCENYESLRGIKPHLVIYDEFQHHSQFFDEEVMQPNLSSGKVHLIVKGTPPKRHCYYIDFRDNLLTQIQQGSTDVFYIELPSVDNPTLDKEWLKRKRSELIRKGKINVWLREYEGKLVFDTEHAIFPFFDDTTGGKHVKPAATIARILQPDRGKLNWYDLYDPGTASVFGALYIAHNPYTSQLFIVDEIYATEKREMTSKAVWNKGTEIRNRHYKNQSAWLHYYDEAALWFANEVMSQFDVGMIPTHKQQAETRRKNDEGRAGESLLNTLMMTDNKFIVSDRCVKFIWEMRNYVTDEKGNYPKKHDHLMDLLFYFIHVSGFEFYEGTDPEATSEFDGEEIKRPKSLEELFTEVKRQEDPLDYEPEYYDYEEYDIWN